jgi:hypothetical protein
MNILYVKKITLNNFIVSHHYISIVYMINKTVASMLVTWILLSAQCCLQKNFVRISFPCRTRE